jgi:uncharacterized protein
MTGDSDTVRVVDNRKANRYELWVDDAVAGSIAYEVRPGRVALIHTEVDPTFEGQGLGTRLVRGALDDISARELKVVPICPFVRAYLRRARRRGER